MTFAPSQVIYITGASSGIGAELARQLAALGAKVALFARRAETLAVLVGEIRGKGGQAEAFALDVTRREDVLQQFAAAARAVGPCDVLIANAGVGFPLGVKRFDSAKAASMINVNVLGMFHACEAVIPSMLERGTGHIVGISSLASYRSLPGSTVYCASKSAVSAFLAGIRLELAGRIAVTTICPGFIRSEMTAANKTPMPFFLECVPACRRIIGAINRRAKVYNFPKRTYWLLKLSYLLPDALVVKGTQQRL